MILKMRALLTSALLAGWAIHGCSGYIPRPRTDGETCTKTTVAVLYVYSPAVKSKLTRVVEEGWRVSQRRYVSTPSERGNYS